MTLPTVGHRFWSIARAALAGALLVSALVFVPAPAQAATPRSGGWYWPVDTEDFKGWDGFWEYRPQNPPRWHLAQDMPAPVGHKVYAVSHGTVLESGGDHGYGGVLVVRHKTADGHYFKAVYGHIRPASGTGKGAKVEAGQVIGRVNSCAHVHFGIHPGRAYPPDNNPYRGHTYTSKNTYGWVDPVKYLRANPRLIPFSAPGLPTVATVETSRAATVLGVSDGSVFWSCDTEATSTVFARRLAGGEAVEVGPDEPLPSLDATRYAVQVSEGVFTLADPVPVLALGASTAAPSWNHHVTLSGKLTNSAGGLFLGARIVVESSTDGVSWTRVTSAITGLTGSYSVSYHPTRRVGLRVRFAATAPYVAAISAVTTIAPKPRLSAPSIPATHAKGRSFTVRGTLSPRHASGSHAVVLRVQRREAGEWIDYSTAVSTCRDSSAGSAYSGALRLPSGTWRVRAQMPSDAKHAAGASSWSGFVIR